MTEHTYVYTRTMSAKFARYYTRNADGALTMILTAGGLDLPTDTAELEALHVLTGQMLQCSDGLCPCVAAGIRAERERRP